MSEEEVQEIVRKYIRDNLTVRINSETSCFHTTDGSEKTRFEVQILLDGEVISNDTYYS